MSVTVYEIGSLVVRKDAPQIGVGTVIEIKDTEYHGIEGFESLGIPSPVSSVLVKVYNISWPNDSLRWHMAYEIDKAF
jgi:hypothetical protein